MKKLLSTTVDFFDDLIHAGKMYTPANVDQLLDYLKTIGVGRIDWIADGRDRMERLYSMPFAGRKNILVYAVERAHALGMQVHVQYKVFETGKGLLPHGFPRPANVPLYDDLRGLHCDVDPFMIAHPDMRFKRIPGEWNPRGRIGRIRLVKSDNAPAAIDPDRLEIWVGERNGSLRRYPDAFTIRDSVEWRARFPVGGPCRVITLEGLSIDERKRYIFVKYRDADSGGCFANTIKELMEIEDENGRLLPSTPAGARQQPNWRNAFQFREFPMAEFSAYGCNGETQTFLGDERAVSGAFSDFYAYDVHHCNPVHVFDRSGYAGVARGKNEYLGGALNPVYAAVRDYWLERIGQYIAWGADGVNIRISNHSCGSDDRDDYGFNEPALAMCGGRADRDAVRKVNGSSFTEFLAAARDLLHKHKRCLSVHVENEFIYPDDRGDRAFWGKTPPNIEWQWPRWVADIADVVCLKNMHFFTRAHAEHFIDAVTCAARRHGKPVIYISTNKEMRFEGDLSRVAAEIAAVIDHPRLDGYDLYETASYTRMSADGRIEGSPAVAEAVRCFR